MEDKRFEELWERAQVERYVSRLQSEYPAWLRRRRVVHSALVGLAVLIVAGVSIYTFQYSKKSLHPKYEAVCCNRSGITDEQWVDMAANILTSEIQ